MFRIFAISLLFIILTFSLQAKEIKIKHGELVVNANLNIASDKSLADGVILMAHGTLAHKDMEIMRALQDLLLERGLSNLAFNYSYAQNDRHGMNDCKGPHRQRTQSIYNEISIWIDWLKNNGAKEIFVLGHSRGGNQIARYVAKSPDPYVRSAVLVAPSTWEKGKESRDYKRRYNKELSPILEKANALVKEGRGDTTLSGIDFIYCPNTKVSAYTFSDYYNPNPDQDTPSVVGQSKVPVLVIAASDDQVVPDISKKMKSHISENVRLEVIEDAGHFFRDLVADELSDIILEYVTTIKN